jgi:hypothetical protein
VQAIEASNPSFVDSDRPLGSVVQSVGEVDQPSVGSDASAVDSAPSPVTAVPSIGERLQSIAGVDQSSVDSDPSFGSVA